MQGTGYSQGFVYDRCQDCGNNDFRQHIGAVIEDGIYQSQGVAGEGFHDFFADSVKTLLGEEPFCPSTKEQGPGDDMDYIAERQGDHRAEADCSRLMLHFIF